MRLDVIIDVSLMRKKIRIIFRELFGGRIQTIFELYRYINYLKSMMLNFGYYRTILRLFTSINVHMDIMKINIKYHNTVISWRKRWPLFLIFSETLTLLEY